MIPPFGELIEDACDTPDGLDAPLGSGGVLLNVPPFPPSGVAIFDVCLSP